MYGWHNGDWMSWSGLLMSVFMLAFWVLVIWGIVWLVRQSPPRTGLSDAPHPPDANMVLDRRFATGEIDEAEYLSRKAVLTAHGPEPGGR